jgi:hypothetical protein
MKLGREEPSKRMRIKVTAKLLKMKQDIFPRNCNQEKILLSANQIISQAQWGRLFKC